MSIWPGRLTAPSKIPSCAGLTPSRKPRDLQTDVSSEYRLAGEPYASNLVEPDGIEPTTSCLQSTRSPN